jgi:ABC-type antimicrobial peptide transport system permease subunit
MALLLAIIGVYAVISYTISQRTKEIGIRVALGAAGSSLTRMFVARGLLWAGLGAVAGLAVSAALSQLMTSLLYEVSPLDPVTYLAAPGAILLAAALASYLPARRAAAVDPMEALRAD